MAFPLFPLKMLPLPGEMVGIHVFEPRFQRLFNELENMEVTEFGIPFSHEGQLWPVGATMRLVTVQKRDANGQRDVAVTATGLFELKYFDANDEFTYPQGDIKPVDDWAKWSLGKECLKARDSLIVAMQTKVMNTSKLENQGLVRLVQHLGLDALQRAEILGQPTLEGKQLMLLERLQLMRRLVEQSPKDGSDFFVN